MGEEDFKYVSLIFIKLLVTLTVTKGERKQQLLTSNIFFIVHS